MKYKSNVLASIIHLQGGNALGWKQVKAPGKLARRKFNSVRANLALQKLVSILLWWELPPVK